MTHFLYFHQVFFEGLEFSINDYLLGKDSRGFIYAEKEMSLVVYIVMLYGKTQVFSRIVSDVFPLEWYVFTSLP